MAVQPLKVAMVGRDVRTAHRRSQEDTFQDDGEITPEL